MRLSQKILAFVFCLSLCMPLETVFSQTQTGQTSTPRTTASPATPQGGYQETGTSMEGNNAIDVGTLYGNIDEAERNIDDIIDNNTEFFSRYSNLEAYNKTADDVNILNLEYLTHSQKNGSAYSSAPVSDTHKTIPDNITILRDRMGKTRNDLLPYLDALENANDSFKSSIKSLRHEYGVLESSIQDVEDYKDMLDICYSGGGSCLSERQEYEDSLFAVQQVQKTYEHLLSIVETHRRMLESAVIEFDQRLRTFRAPRVINADILPGPKVSETQENPRTGMQYISDKLIPGVVNWLMVALMGVSVIMIIIAGVLYVFSESDEPKEKAKGVLIWTFVGFIVAVLAFTIVRFVVGLDIAL